MKREELIMKSFDNKKLLSELANDEFVLGLVWRWTFAANPQKITKKPDSQASGFWSLKAFPWTEDSVPKFCKNLINNWRTLLSADVFPQEQATHPWVAQAVRKAQWGLINALIPLSWSNLRRPRIDHRIDECLGHRWIMTSGWHMIM